MIYVCKICLREFHSLRGFALHIVNTEKISREQYYNTYLRKSDTEGYCMTCGKPTTFSDICRGYKFYCSTSCSAKSEITKKRREETNLRIFGETSNLKTSEHKKKIRETNLRKYGTEYPARSEQVKKKYRETCFEKYGVYSTLQSEVVKTKIQKTNIDKYGCINPMQNKEILEKTRITVQQKYGVDHVFQNDEIKEKSRRTCISKYGVANYSQSPEFLKKMNETCMEKFGVDYPMQSFLVKSKNEETCLSRYGVTNVAKSPEVKDKIFQRLRRRMFNILLNSDRLKSQVKPLFTYNEFSTCEPEYLWECLVCGTKFSGNLHDGAVPRCTTCYPKKQSSSYHEFEVFRFCEQYCKEDIIQNAKILENKKQEVDIYIPGMKLAIEFNGLYWHSELNGRSWDYHLKKTQECLDKGIHLVHVFEDEWIGKKEIVKSILKSKMGQIDNRIFARKCELMEINDLTAGTFLFDNHLQGSLHGRHFGLFFENQLVSVITVGPYRFGTEFDIEIYRFCSKIDTVVVGGLSRLINHVIKVMTPKNIISYVDRRYGKGDIYEHIGFKKVRATDPGYFYLDSNAKRFSRWQFQKHLLKDKLKTFDPNLTEWQNMQLNGYDRIWDCGNYVYVKDLMI